MKYLFFLLILTITLNAKVYMAQIQPFEKFIFSAKVSGLVEYVNDDAKSKITTSQIIRLDSKISKIKYDILKSIYEIRKDIYNKTKNLKTKSKAQKDTEKLSYLQAKQNYELAKDDYQSRSIKVKNLYIHDIKVNEGSFAQQGSTLFIAYDLSKSKLEIYVTLEELKDIENKTFIVDGKDDFKLYKYYKIADDVYISSYKVVLVSDKNINFSKIVKVEIK